MKLNKNLIVLGLALILTFAFVGDSDALLIDLVLPDPVVAPSDTFSMDVWARNVFDVSPADEVLAFGFDVSVSDPSVANVISWTVGPLFSDDSSFFPNTDVAGSAFPGITDNDILLAKINFQAYNIGVTSLGIESDLNDLNEGLVYLFTDNQDITADTPVNVVPEPASLTFLGVGMMGLLGFRKKQKS